jgi:hypothetical protein
MPRLKDFGLRPEPPRWALDEGLPEPLGDETFIPYVQRLGLQAEPLLVELTQKTIPLANGRLATTLSRTMRPAFDRHVDSLVTKHIEPVRRRQIEMMAYNIFGVSFRRRPV